MVEVLTCRLSGMVSCIEGFTDLLFETLTTPEQRETAFRIFESVSQIERVLIDLQHYSQSVQPVLRTRPLRTIFDALLAALSDADLGRVDLRLPSDLEQPITADPLLLRQALLALLRNALDVAPQQESVRLECSISEPDQALRFNVWNKGYIEVPQAEEIVFDAFYTTKVQNLGLGLSIARRIVEAHQGQLLLASNDPVEGVTFSLILPLDPGQALRCP
jgi:signal transduction histidine kinase